MIFTKSRTNVRLGLKLNGEIPYTYQLKFLGVIFDKRLNFKVQIDKIRPKCKDRLSIPRILSSKNWGPRHQVVGNIYKSLIGSVVNYSFFCLDLVSEPYISRL